MTVSIEPAASLSTLPLADGSVTYSKDGYIVIGTVNGPIEVQRRDELPEEATVDVIVRPAAGIGGTRERHLESVLQSSLRQIILIKNFPRALIQITLQITSSPEDESIGFKLNQASTNLLILPALIQASVLALLSAALPLSVTMTSTILAIMNDGNIAEHPTIHEIQQATSVHVFAFTSHGELLLDESEGNFNIDDWDMVFERAQSICCGVEEAADVDVMLDEGEKGNSGLVGFLRSTLEEKSSSDLKWKKLTLSQKTS